MAVSKRTRFEVLRRDNYTCRYCGASAPDVKLTVDHVVPVTLGGSDAPDNLVAACRDCNAGKSSTPADASLVADVQRDALRWAAAMKQAAAHLTAQREARLDYVAAFEVTWDRYRLTDTGMPVPRHDYAAGLTQLYESGLPEEHMLEAIHRTMDARGVLPENRVRYFFGVAWNVVRDMQAMASAIVAEGV